MASLNHEPTLAKRACAWLRRALSGPDHFGPRHVAARTRLAWPLLRVQRARPRPALDLQEVPVFLARALVAAVPATAVRAAAPAARGAAAALAAADNRRLASVLRPAT